MIQRIVKVTKAETLPTKDGKKTYLSVVLSDGNRENKYSVFDPGLQKTLQDAHKSGESVNVGLEKEGNFWNVKSAEITTELVEEKKTELPKTTYGKHSDKDSEVESSKRTVLMQATLLYMHSTDASVPFNKDEFIKICGVCRKELGLDNPLVEAIKKEGGIEVEK